ncbi:MAG TPA: hypothetical protein VKE22_23620 [Haliangiales bacterium]|nr:hypothetical protein [Haliangiales bacterium]
MRWVTLVGLVACTAHVDRSLTLPINAAGLDKRSAFLKAHMKDGSVYLLRRWTVNSPQRLVAGIGELQDAHRRVVAKGPFEVRLDDVALFETNVVETSAELAPLAVVTGASIAMTVFCLTNTKSCFGSCPTFYLGGELRAEGFSESVAPSLEATDVDAIGPHPGGTVIVRMTNEAYETHVVKRVALLAAPRPAGGRVLAESGEDHLWRSTRLAPPVACRAAEGDCLASMGDGRERFSPADGEDLAAREEIHLTFAPQAGPLGLAVSTRQTMLSTYLFYQGLAWMGRDAGRRLADLERGGRDVAGPASTLRDLLGGIEVHVRRNGEWARAGEARETGPLAVDTHLVRLPALPSNEPIEVRLRLTKGLWRIGDVTLATLDGAVEPIRAVPRIVPVRLGRRFGGERAPQTAFPLTTLPGDAYDLEFRLPDGDYELFLESRGYYLEWLREEWLAEESPAKAALLFLAPRLALRMLAPAFKAHEAEMEAAFWRSRYAE